jgi:hypothetical protein
MKCKNLYPEYRYEMKKKQVSKRKSQPDGSIRKKDEKTSIFWDITPCSPRKIKRLLYAGFLFGIFFEPEDGGDMFLRIMGLLSTDYTALYPRR